MQQLQPFGRWGVELTLGRLLTNYFGSGNAAIFKIAWEGTSLAVDWSKTGATWAWWISNLVGCRAGYGNRKIAYEGFCWIQGEYDAGNSAYALAYTNNLVDLRSRVRGVLGVTNLPFVVVPLGDAEGDTYKATVQGAQYAITNGDAMSYAIDTHALSYTNSQHWSLTEYYHVGTNLFEAVAKLKDWQ